VDDAFFACRVSPIDARAALGLPAEGTILGVPGTLRPMKGHPFLFEALARLSGMGVGLTVAVTGAGESAYTERLRAMTRTLGIDAFVRFLGPVEDMSAFYRACDLVCVPSVAEPFGRTVIEAFAVGVPVIASAVGGILEIVIHERTGLLVDYGNTEALAASVARLRDDPELRRALSREAGRQARAEYRAVVYQARIARIVAGVLGPTPDGVLLAGSPRGVLVR
jgi:glycosyltransferase involved in cell wall biosynthesis